jgi:hypothetical protein
MKEEAATDASLRQFLLGRVEDEERERIESLFITDSVMRDKVLAAEQKLMDDYLEDSLSAADIELFLSLYGDTAVQRRKLRIAKSIQEWAVNQPDTMSVATAPSMSVWDRLRAQFRLKPVLVIPIAVTIVLAIVLALAWVNSRRNERNREYLALQHELDRLNTPSSVRELRAQLPPLTLKPSALRSVDPQPELTISSNVPFAELRLLWMQQEDYLTYNAVVRRTADDQEYTVSNLTVENQGGKVVRVRLPARMLTRGNYQIELRGVAADGSKSPPEIYSFPPEVYSFTVSEFEKP